MPEALIKGSGSCAELSPRQAAKRASLVSPGSVDLAASHPQGSNSSSITGQALSPLDKQSASHSLQGLLKRNSMGPARLNPLTRRASLVTVHEGYESLPIGITAQDISGKLRRGSSGFPEARMQPSEQPSTNSNYVPPVRDYVPPIRDHSTSRLSSQVQSKAEGPGKQTSMLAQSNMVSGHGIFDNGMAAGAAVSIRPLASMPTEPLEAFLELHHSSTGHVEAFTYTPISPELQTYRR